jgi:hypothetical protein
LVLVSIAMADRYEHGPHAFPITVQNSPIPSFQNCSLEPQEANNFLISLHD